MRAYSAAVVTVMMAWGFAGLLSGCGADFLPGSDLSDGQDQADESSVTTIASYGSLEA